MRNNFFSKQYIIYIILLTIIPTFLYINFFFFKLTLLFYVIKAWIIYSLLIITGEILVIILANSIFFIVNKFFKLLDSNLRLKFIDLAIKAFLIGNIFLSMAIFERLMYIYLAFFQGLLISLFHFKFINKNFVKKNKLSIIKQLFTIKNIKTSNNLYKELSASLLIITLYTSLNMLNIYIIKKNYNPLRKSLTYYNDNLGKNEIKWRLIE